MKKKTMQTGKAGNRSVGAQGGARQTGGGQASGEGSREGAARTPMKRMTEYGTQLAEKQKVKELYGMREKQFRRFFADATRSKEAAGDRMLSLLERRLDNVVYRLKFASSRSQARQIVVHGHVLVNGKRVSSPSCLVEVNDEITLAPQVRTRQSFLDFVVAKRMKKAIKPPEWLELQGEEMVGRVLRFPVRSDIKTPIEEHHIIEFYSK